MKTLRVVVYGEGKHELGAGAPREVSRKEMPALARLVDRLLGEPQHVSYECRPFSRVPPVHKKGPRFARKTQSAIYQAHRDGFDAVAVVVDRDRNSDADRIEALREGRDGMGPGNYPPCAVGVAVETFDAWMIVDGGAVKAAGGKAGNSFLGAEGLSGKEGSKKHPKDVARTIFGEDASLSERYAIVAGCVDLEHLVKCCPRGFGRFAEDIRTHLTPVVKGK